MFEGEFGLPQSHDEDPVDDYDFMNGMKLGEAATGDSDLVSKLKYRFNLLPLKRVCYLQSYHTLQEIIDSIQSIIKADPDACSKVDFLGMSRFRIFALSQKPWLNLFQELLSISSMDIMTC
mmetsp:Transcript_40082/g.96771  ORF Transcript_40082/g.96771 Transcript_40082/m.96771 type:complete len:121 (+) Transcript_40082:1005-1367(+)